MNYKLKIERKDSVEWMFIISSIMAVIAPSTKIVFFKKMKPSASESRGEKVGGCGVQKKKTKTKR